MASQYVPVSVLLLFHPSPLWMSLSIRSGAFPKLSDVWGMGRLAAFSFRRRKPKSQPVVVTFRAHTWMGWDGGIGKHGHSTWASVSRTCALTGGTAMGITWFSSVLGHDLVMFFRTVPLFIGWHQKGAEQWEGVPLLYVMDESRQGQKEKEGKRKILNASWNQCPWGCLRQAGDPAGGNPAVGTWHREGIPVFLLCCRHLPKSCVGSSGFVF